MTKQEALRIAAHCSERVGKISPGTSVMIDGHFSVEQVEAIAVLMRAANESGVDIDHRYYKDVVGRCPTCDEPVSLCCCKR